MEINISLKDIVRSIAEDLETTGRAEDVDEILSELERQISSSESSS